MSGGLLPCCDQWLLQTIEELVRQVATQSDEGSDLVFLRISRRRELRVDALEAPGHARQQRTAESGDLKHRVTFTRSNDKQVQIGECSYRSVAGS